PSVALRCQQARVVLRDPFGVATAAAHQHRCRHCLCRHRASPACSLQSICVCASFTGFFRVSLVFLSWPFLPTTGPGPLLTGRSVLRGGRPNYFRLWYGGTAPGPILSN